MKTVAIFRQALLPISETFIHAQANALRSFHPQYIGLSPSNPSLPIPSDAISLTPDKSLLSRCRAQLYNSTGVAPFFHRRVNLTSPVLIHAHFAPDGAAALPLATALQVPLLVTLHGYDVTVRDANLRKTLAGKLYLRRRPRLWEHASLFLCVSNFIRDQAIETGFPKDKLRVHFIGIDRQLFRATEGRPEKLVLFVGRLVPKKGCIHLLRSMRRVQDQEPSARLVIIGDGPLRASLETTSKDLRLRCEFLGGQPSAVVKEWIRRANLLCIPSVTASDGGGEGLGMVILEAQAMGRPVVGFRSGGIPEALLDGVSGLLAPVGDEEKLASHILRYLQDEIFWQGSSAQAIEWTAERFDIDRQTRELESIYNETLEMHRTEK